MVLTGKLANFLFFLLLTLFHIILVQLHLYLVLQNVSCKTLYELKAEQEITMVHLLNYALRRISIQCKMSRDWLLASAFFWITNSQAEQISLAVVDFTHFKRKRSLKIDRATFCTEWKSAFSFVKMIAFVRRFLRIHRCRGSHDLFGDAKNRRYIKVENKLPRIGPIQYT